MTTATARLNAGVRPQTATTPATPVNPDREAIDLVRDLVAAPSISGHEQGAVRLFAERMSRLGYRAAVDIAGNAVGVIGSTDPEAPEIVLLGHIDTVPGRIPVRVDEDGFLWGRGSVDAKGPLAAFAIAGARAALPKGVRLIVVGAVGEETPTSPGARFIRDRHRPVACIIGEPSHWDRYTVGYKGRLLVEATFEQNGGHSAGPQGAVAERAVRWWNHLRANIGEWNIGREGLFDTIQASLQHMDTSSDGLVDRARATVGLRLPTWADPAAVEADLRTISPGVELRIYGHTPGVRTGRANAVSRALASAITDEGGRARAVVKTGTSDMNTVFRAWGCPIAAYGPGDSTLDHTPEERLDLAEYLRSIRVLSGAIERIACDHSA